MTKRTRPAPLRFRARRQFLQDSMFAAAAAAVSTTPMISSVAKAQSKSANEKLLCAVIGCRGRGGSHISAFSGRKDCQIAYIVDVDEKVGQNCCNSIEKRTGRRPKWVKDMRRVFDDKSVDIVGTATPNHWHALCGVWAMQAGKDVYIEKPISHDIPEVPHLWPPPRNTEGYARWAHNAVRIRPLRTP